MTETPKTNLPNLIVIGAMKCGTTSLHYNLNLHPEIAMSREKELNFFCGERAWGKGLEWYGRQFPTGTTWRGESSPAYARAPFNDTVAARMHQHIPDARLIYIVRNPIDRTISNYFHWFTINQETRSIEDAISDFPASKYVQGSRYHYQLSHYLEYFSEAQIHVLTLESLHQDPVRAMRDIFLFLGVDDRFTSPQFSVVRHKSSHKGQKNRVGLLLKHLSDSKAARIFPTDMRMRLGRILYAPFTKKTERPTIEPSLRQELLAYLEEDIVKLEDFTGLDLSHWRTEHKT